MKANVIAKTQTSWTLGLKRMTRRHKRICLRAPEEDRGELLETASSHCYKTQYNRNQSSQKRSRRLQSSRNSCRFSRSQLSKDQSSRNRSNRRQCSRLQSSRLQLNRHDRSLSSSSSKSHGNAKLTLKSHQRTLDFLQPRGRPRHQNQPIYQAEKYNWTRSHNITTTDASSFAASQRR